jgi:hypothetical protein
MIHLPESTPEHLIKFHNTEEAQMNYCRSIGCHYNCLHCVNFSESIPTPTTMPIKEKISQVRVTPTKYDNLAQKALNKGFKKHNHVLWDYIIEKFTKG